jgi:hypothetical protein
MHIDAVGAAVDLGGAEFNEMQEVVFEAAVLEMSFQREHGLQRVGGILVVRNAGLHRDRFPFFVVAVEIYFPATDAKIQGSWKLRSKKDRDKPAATKNYHKKPG